MGTTDELADVALEEVLERPEGESMTPVRLFAVSAISAITFLLAARKVDTSAPGSRDEVAEIRGKVALLVTSVEKGDLESLDRLYSTDPPAQVIENGIADDWKHYRDGHLAPELKELKNLRFRCENVHAEVSADLAWATCEVSLQANFGERVIDSTGRETFVFRRTGREWQIVHSHSSTRPRKK